MIKRFLATALALLAISTGSPGLSQSTINGRGVTVDGVRLDTALANKANAGDVAASLAVKANANDVASSLAAKANTTDVAASLAVKADSTAVTVAIDAVKTLGEVTFGRLSAPNSDLTAEMQVACASASAQGYTLRLPPIRFYSAKTCVAAKVVGTPGKSVVVLAANFTKTGWANQFAFINPNFTIRYTAAADEILYRDFDIEVETAGPISVLGFANVKSGLVERVNITALPVLVAGVPATRDTLIDLYGAVKKFRIVGNTLRNVTGAHGPGNNFSAGGGSEIWVRNFSADGANPVNVTEDVEVTGNVLYHYTSDEGFAVFGVRGICRRIIFHHNYVYGQLNAANDNNAAPGGVYHNTLISFFPLRDSSDTNGQYAAVTDSAANDNYIEDRSFAYTVLRIGNSTDAANRLENVTTARNKVGVFQSTNSSTGVLAAWTAAGSPSGFSPTAASIAVRNIDGTQGVAFNGTFSGNTSSDDVVYTLAGGTETINTAFGGFPAIFNPTTRGSIFTGIGSVGQVSGGLVEAAGRAFFNSSVTGARYRVTLASGFAFVVSTGLQYTMIGTNGSSTGGFISVAAGASTATRILVASNLGSASAGYAVNNTVSGATVIARMNDVSGAPSGIATGAGTYTGSLNRWGSAAD